MAENTRGCYCGSKQDSEQGQVIPDGFCGICDLCGRPGHTRHFPGSLPVTGSWCDFHYRMVAVIHPSGAYAKYFWSCIVVLLIVGLNLLPRWLG